MIEFRRPDEAVVSTEGLRPEWRDLLSTIGRLVVEKRSLGYASLRSGRRVLRPVASPTFWKFAPPRA